MTAALRGLVVGASGFIGGALYRTLAGRGHPTQGTFHSESVRGLLRLDVRDAEAVEALMGEIRPEIVFHPAANPNVDWCEACPEESWAVNVAGLGHVLAAVRRWGARLVYFSSDYVFDGTAGPYAETDRPNPISVYGRQKLACERMIQDAGEDHLIVRVTVVYGWERRGKNFVQRLINDLRAGRPTRVPADQVGSPTYVANLAEAVSELAEKGCRGIYHVAGADPVDRYTFARAIAETFGLDERLLVPVSTLDLGQRAARPLNAGMRLDKVLGVLSTPLLGYREGLARMRREDQTWNLE